MRNVMVVFGIGMALLLAAGSLASVQANGAALVCQWAVTPPVTDGAFTTPGEYPEPPQISMTLPDYPIEAYVYLVNDAQYLYAIVDAVGDETDTDPSPAPFPAGISDECLLVFGAAAQTQVEVVGTTQDGIEFTDVPPGTTVAVGFGPSPHSAGNHRIFEFKIPLAGIGGVPGQGTEFASPYSQKWLRASMPYDATTGRDNVWPADFYSGDPYNWTSVQFAPLPTGVPALGAGGVLLFALLLGTLALAALRRRRRAE